jgi:site-specific recombinase XerD
MSTPTAPVLRDWLDEWDLVLRSSDLAHNSCEIYMRGGRAFLAWLATAAPDVRDPGKITARHAHRYAEWLKTEGFSKATRAGKLFAVRRWLNYVAEQPDGGLSSNPFAGVQLPRADPMPPATMPDDELRALLATCRGSGFLDLRDEAVIRLLIDTGVRVGELVGINVDDLDLARQEVRVSGKTGTRLAPIGAKTSLALRKYLRARARRDHAQHRALFQAIRPRPDGSVRLTDEGVRHLVGRRCTLAGIGHRHPHQLRHTWAGDMLEHGATEGDLARLGGWVPGSRMVAHYGSADADRRARTRARTLSRGDRV